MQRVIDLTEPQRAALLGVFAPLADRIATVGIYGSRVQGRARPGSDVDLVVYGRLLKDDVGRLLTDLEESELSIFADLVDYDGIAYLPLKSEIDRWMLPLFTTDDLRSANLVFAPAAQRG